MKTVPFWTDQYPRPDDLDEQIARDLPSKVDIAIVGSGHTGLNAAFTIAKAGLKVAVLEQETIGWGASSRHGTFVSPSLKAEWETIEKRYGLEKARQFWKWAVASVEHVRDIVQEERLDCDLRKTGTLGLAVKPSHADSLQKYSEYLQTTFGYGGSQYIPQDELKTNIGSSIFYGGVTSELAYQVHPAKYVFGLAEATLRHGVTLVEGAQVKRIVRSGNSQTLQTSRGRIEAGKVLLATNGYTTSLLPQARNGILPVGSYMIVTEPLSPEAQAEISPQGRLFWDSKIFLNYFGLTPDGRAFMGGRANLSPNQDLSKTGAGLTARLFEIFPQLQGTEITHSWSGRLGVSFDQMPHIGRVGNIYYANGFSGQGVATGSYMGKEVGELMLGMRQSSLFMDIKQPRTFLAPLDKIYLPFVSAWFRFLDWTQ
jgi:glycine/D-amino acid oxidase-like deaminating enzyme